MRMKLTFCFLLLTAASGILCSAENGAAADWIGRGKEPMNLCAENDYLFVAGKPLYVFSAKSFPVKEDGKYVLSGKFRKNSKSTGSAELFFGIACYDGDGKHIQGSNVCAVSNTETELIAAAQKGDRVLKVKNASSWEKRSGSVVAFATKPGYADLPNWNISPVVTHIEKAGEDWEITFRLPLRKDYPAGTGIRQQIGGAYIYAVSSQTLSENWSEVSKSFNGIGPGELWSGTKSVKIVIFGTIGKPAGICMKDVTFKEIK